MLSFLDDADEPVRRGRASRPSGGGARPPRGPGVDRQALMVRRTVAGGGALLILILLIFGIRGCLDARKERAIKDYVRDAKGLVQDSNQLSEQLFDSLAGSGGDNQQVQIETQLNGYRSQAEQLVERAENLDVPDEMARAQRYMVETFESRRDGVAGIADAIPTAVAQDNRREGTDEIAIQMQSLLASDVVFRLRVRPAMGAALKQEKISESLPSSEFLPDVDWLQPAVVAQRVRSGGGGASGPASPGLHGTGLGTVTLGGQVLTAGGTTTVSLQGNPTFSIQVANQGENDETDVVVTVTIGRGNDAIKREDTIPEIAAGETKSVEIPLDDRPVTGEQVPVNVEIQAVPGEQKTDNNKAGYTVIFTR
jgi:hypothetical protein